MDNKTPLIERLRNPPPPGKCYLLMHEAADTIERLQRIVDNLFRERLDAETDAAVPTVDEHVLAPLEEHDPPVAGSNGISEASLRERFGNLPGTTESGGTDPG